MKEIVIKPQDEGQRLDKYLLKYMNTAPKSFVYKMLRKKRIKYNHGKALGSEILQAGDALQLYLAEETLEQFMEEKKVAFQERHFGIVHEEAELLVVAKPAGLLTQREKADSQNTLVDQILSYLAETGEYCPGRESAFTPGVCNRLDRNTSGLVLCGKSQRATAALNRAIAERKIQKEYLTIIKGCMEKEGVLSAFLKKDRDKNEAHISTQASPGAKKIEMAYKTIAQNGTISLIEINLITGKSHQIRAHLSFLGHPVAGDQKYGDAKANLEYKRRFGLCHQFLHAYHIGWEPETLPMFQAHEFFAKLPRKNMQMLQELFPDAVFPPIFYS